MEKAAYCILILCGIFSQGICNVSEENNEKSTDLLIRQRRVIGAEPRRLNSSPSLVHVLENGNQHCTATLLTADVVITSAACFFGHNTRYMKILSRPLGDKALHDIVRVNFLDPNYNPARPTFKNLALARFAPAINFHMSNNEPTKIYSGDLTHHELTNRVITFQKPFHIEGRRIPSDMLQTFGSIAISIEYCQELYGNRVGAGNLCGVGASPGQCCVTSKDSGVPLFRMNELLGIFVYRDASRRTNPDVFMNLLDHDIRRWIHAEVPSLRLF